MKLIIRKYKLSNLYSFIANLSQWNELSCVPQRKKEWISKTGRLTEIEKKAIKNFSNIFINAKVNLELIFLFEKPKSIWVETKKEIGKQKTVELKKIFKLFEPKFNLLWNQNKKRLAKISKLFKSRQNEINNNLILINKLCGISKRQTPKKIEVLLLLSSEVEEAQGWSWNNKIILECSGWPVKKNNYLINCIFLHEVFHCLIKLNKKLFNDIEREGKRIKKYLPSSLKLWQPKIILEDVLLSGFLPEGYLAEKFCGIDVKKEARKELAKKSLDDFTRIRNSCALELYDTAKEYVENNKVIDTKFLNQIVNCIKKRQVK